MILEAVKQQCMNMDFVFSSIADTVAPLNSAVIGRHWTYSYMPLPPGHKCFPVRGFGFGCEACISLKGHSFGIITRNN